ncbi:hypothetical protein V8G54_021668 [Vigna mungo]|uniref:Copia protein n=1 Tax=Vigna mungo TaxID=3915 RepID=A0AAQ3NER4_VIGMU
MNLCLYIKPSNDLDIIRYSDASWATSIDDEKSMRGQCVFLIETLVSLSSRKQKVVSRSSRKSEYRALADLAAKVAWIRSLLTELKLPMLKKPILLCDNLSAKSITFNPVMHTWFKHIEMNVHYIRDQILQKEVMVVYVPTINPIAAYMTKPLIYTRFNLLRDNFDMTMSLAV